MGIFVETPGILTTIQDKGLFGYESFGVSPSGPLDLESFEIANLLVSNYGNEAGLEVTMMGPTLQFRQDNVIAITGADISPLLNEEPVPMNSAIAVHSGDVLRLQTAKDGCRAYIAFAGGLDVPEIMGSRATGVQNKVGGKDGRKLQAGDEIAFLAPRRHLPGVKLRKAEYPLRAGKRKTVRVILGPQEECFTPQGIGTFLSSTYKVTPESDRMGCRLSGGVIEHRVDGNIISDGMATGAIQVPTNGQPIVMLAERQTIGGYTKIATVISDDLPILGQSRPGDEIQFQMVTIDEAHRLWRERCERLQALKAQMEQLDALNTDGKYTVHMNGQSYELTIEPILD